MKIYNEIVFDIDGNVLYEDSYEYSGSDIILCQRNIIDVQNFANSVRKPDGTFSQEHQEIIDEMMKNVMNETGGGGSLLSQLGSGEINFTEYELATQTQSGDVQINALPSLPSISNVGSVPFTGTVSTIPGGFQPLPQTAGGRKKLYQLSKFHGGLNQKSHARDISDIECALAFNVTFSQIGRIKILGDIRSTSSGLTTAALHASNKPPSGHGWYIFKSAYSLADPPVVGNEAVTINVVQNSTVAKLTDDASPTTLSLADVSSSGVNMPIYYAAGSGFYANDGLFASTQSRKCAVLVYREDFNGHFDNASTGNNDSIMRGWVQGEALISSPVYHASNSNAFEVLATHTPADAAGRMHVTADPVGTGTWGAGGTTTYYFYLSWLFDNGCETGLSGIAAGIDFTDQALDFNISVLCTNSAPVGGDKRIEGARVYFKKAGTAERWLLGEVSLIDGAKGALDSTFTPWDITAGASAIYDLSDEITIVDPPEVYSYSSLNGYYANEVYTKSPDIYSAAPTAIDVRYKTAVVGSGGIVFIGNVRFNKKELSDSMMFSMPGKPAVFPKFNIFDSPSSDGSAITALASFKDTILQFKQNAMYVINVSNPAQFYAQASYRNCGVGNQCQVFTASFGVIFANQHGCYIYDGQKVTSLTDGKFTVANWAITSDIYTGDGSQFPSVGYDPRSQSIIVLKNLESDVAANDEDAFVYNMPTQSWTVGTSFFDNVADDNISNFQIAPNGYLSLIRYAASGAGTNPFTYAIGDATGTTQDIIYQTKDLDFGLPSQTKKIFKVYITYRGECDGFNLFYGVDNGSLDKQFKVAGGSGADKPLSDVGTTLTTVELIPTTASEATGIKSFALQFNGTAGEDFEINDISILYRARPIK